MRIVFPVVAGLLFGLCRASSIVEANRVVDLGIGRNQIISGTVATTPKQKNNQQSFALSGISFNYSTSVIKSQIYVTVSNDARLEEGDWVCLSGSLGDGFGAYRASLYRAQALTIYHDENWLKNLRANFLAKLKNALPEPESSLATSYLFGRSDLLPDSLSEAIRNVGLAHIVAVSGFHLGLILTAARKIFGKISRFATL